MFRNNLIIGEVRFVIETDSKDPGRNISGGYRHENTSSSRYHPAPFGATESPNARIDELADLARRQFEEELAEAVRYAKTHIFDLCGAHRFLSDTTADGKEVEVIEHVYGGKALIWYDGELAGEIVQGDPGEENPDEVWDVLWETKYEDLANCPGTTIKNVASGAFAELDAMTD